MRRVRSAIILVALACAVLGGSSSAVSAGGARISRVPVVVNGPVMGKRWD